MREYQTLFIFETMDKNIGYKSLIEQMQLFASLKIDSWRLLVTERSTLLLSTLLITVVSMILGSCILLFVSVACAHLLAESMSMMCAYLIIGGCYGLLLIVIVAMRRKIIVDPMARFLSKLFLDQPESDGDETA